MNHIAKIISIIGHPLMLGTGYVIFISFYELDKNTAWLISGIIVGLVTLPITIHNWIRLKNGSYTNFDVSDQKQRRGFYPFSIFLFFICFLIFSFLDFPRVVIVNTVFFTIMLCMMALVNFKSKASLHLAIAMFIAGKLLSLSLFIGSLYLFLVFLIAWSRWYLGRHSKKELLIGSILGFVSGWFALLF